MSISVPQGVGDRLLALLRGESIPFTEERQWEAILELAARHGVVPLLARQVDEQASPATVPPTVRRRLRSARRIAGARNARLLAALEAILRRLALAGVDAIVLKGAHLAELVYDEVALRPMGDVDLLVRPRQLATAMQALRSLGYGSGRSGDHQEPFGGNVHVAAVRGPGGVIVEIHYALGIASHAKNPEVEGVWTRAQHARFGEASGLVLSPVDLLLHLCLHAGAHHGFGVSLVHVWDIPVVVQRLGDRLDWIAFWDRARSWGIERSALLTLALAERLLAWSRPGACRAAGPKDPEPAWVASAERLVFSDAPSLVRSANFHAVWSRAGIRQKLGLVFDRAFPSREAIAFEYGVRPDAWAVPLLYPVRLGRLVARYAPPGLRLLGRRPDAVAWLRVETERARMRDWLLDSVPE